MTSPEPIPGTRAVQRVLTLLRAFSQEEVGMSLTQLSARAHLNRATAHRMLSVLEQEGFVVRSSETGEYQLGPEIIVLGSRALRAIDLRTVARPELVSLAEATGEDASLESLVGDEVLILDEVRGRGLMGLATEIGTRWPAHATATGKAILAFADGPLTEPDGGLCPRTDHTITRWDRFLDHLSRVREAGYATNLEELEYGYVSVAAPVRNREGWAAAALSVGGSAHRVAPERIPELAVAVKEAAARVSRRLGFRAPAHD